MNPSFPRRLPVLLVLAIAASLLLSVPMSVSAQEAFSNVERLDVASFAEAGLAVSQRSYEPDTTTAVVLVTEENFPDALTASAVAAQAGGPVLFTGRDALGEATAAEIDRLLDDGDTIHVMGGPEAISTAVTDELSQTYTVNRIAGPTRLETAAAAATQVGIADRVVIARAFGPDGANTDSDRTTGWVDAISCGAYAAAERIPVLLTQTDVLSDATRDAIDGSDATRAIVCGGEVAVSTAVSDELVAMGLDVQRVQGPTRVETAIDAARNLFGLDTARGNSYVVAPGYGESFGYGLAAAPLGLPILLVGTTEPTDCTDQSQPSRATLCYLESGSDEPAELLVIGDGTVIGDDVVEAVATAAGGTDVADVDVLDAPTGVSVEDDVDDDGTQLTVSWEPVEDPDDILAGYIVYVDGEPYGGEGPTTGPDTTEVVLEGLAEGEEVTITVTAVDTEGRESDPSEPVTATPEDEAPDPVDDFSAQPGANRVTLTWDRGPADAASYQLSRATADGAVCGTYSDLATVSDPDTTTYTDTTAANGTAYCYQITVTDESGQASEPATAGPVTPAEPQLGIEIVNIPAEFTFHTGYPHVIETTTTVPSGTDLTDLTLVIEFIPEDTTLTPIIIFDGAHPATADVETTWRLLETQTFGDDPATAYDDAVGTLRASVFTGTGAPTDDEVEDVEVQRAPEQVTGLQAVGGNGVVQLQWDRSPEPTTTGYRIERATAQVTEQTDDPSACSNPALSWSQIGEQPVSDTTYTDDDAPNGTGLTDNRYCYRVRAFRPPAEGLDEGDQEGEASEVDSANTDEADADLTIVEPDSGTTVRERRSQTVTWTIAVPEGGTPTESTTLTYCVDYGPNLIGQDTCNDAGGWKPMEITGDSDNVVPSATAAGQTRTFSAQWEVPNINQDSDTTGAVRAQTQGGTDINGEISFR